MGSKQEVPIAMVDQLLSLPDPVQQVYLIEMLSQCKTANKKGLPTACFTTHTRYGLTPGTSSLRAQGVTIDVIRAEVSCMYQVEKILRCWASMYSETVALDSFAKFVSHAQGILAPSEDKETTALYTHCSAASCIANMYFKWNGWYEATTEAQSPQAPEKPSTLEPAVVSPNQYIQEHFSHLYANADAVEPVGNHLSCVCIQSYADNKPFFFRSVVV